MLAQIGMTAASPFPPFLQSDPHQQDSRLGRCWASGPLIWTADAPSRTFSTSSCRPGHRGEETDVLKKKRTESRGFFVFLFFVSSSSPPSSSSSRILRAEIVYESMGPNKPECLITLAVEWDLSRKRKVIENQ